MLQVFVLNKKSAELLEMTTVPRFSPISPSEETVAMVTCMGEQVNGLRVGQAVIDSVPNVNGYD